METSAASITPALVGLRYGILLAVSSILVDFLIRVAGFSFLTYGVISILGASIVTVVWLVQAHAAFKKANGMLMSFGQGVTIAVTMLLLSATAASLFNYVFVRYIDPDFIANLKAGMTEFLERSNVPDSQIASNTAKFDEMNAGLGKSILNGLKNGLMGGLVLGAIVSAFTKRNAPEFE